MELADIACNSQVYMAIWNHKATFYYVEVCEVTVAKCKLVSARFLEV